MKTIRNAYKKMITFDALVRAHKLARKGRSHYTSVGLFELNLNSNIYKLKSELENKTYTAGEYRTFIVREPKSREIKAIEYKDRVIFHALVDNVLWPFFESRLDYDNAACRTGKGTHFGLKRVASHMRDAFNKHGRDFYILKCDISKYFYSIRHDVLKKNLYKYISDNDVIWLLDQIIDSTPGNVGIPIGNLSSQFFAVFYLNVLDKFVRNELKIEHYCRYMDDFILIHHDKAYLTECLERLHKFLADLGLRLNKKTQMFPAKNGVDYLGFHSYITPEGGVYRKLRKRSKAAMKRKIRLFVREYPHGRIPFDKIRSSVASWCGHAKFGDTFRLRTKVTEKLVLLPIEQTEQKTRRTCVS
jgi:retron-type reverse transcriptase